MQRYNKADYYKPLEECSKEEVDGEVSEYDTMVAISRMPDTFTDAELRKEVHQVVTNRNLSALVDKGLIEARWDAEQEAVVFYPKG